MKEVFIGTGYILQNLPGKLRRIDARKITVHSPAP
jgi:hypothetical protein